MIAVAQLIRVMAEIFTWVVIAKILLSYFLSPYHPVREALDRIVEPFLTPIRRVVPAAGMFDFSPVVLIILVELISRILISVFVSI